MSPTPNPTTTDAGSVTEPAAITRAAPVTAERIRPPRRNLPPAIIAAAIVFGLVCGAFEITNTAIGWHLASGRWMIENSEILDHDIFSFTSGGAEWIDHEWLFQIASAALFDLGGAPALVVMRMIIVAALMLLLVRIGMTSGLDPPVALVLASLAVLGARERFFLRPELFTLLLLPLAMWLFADRRGRRFWPLPLVAVIALGVNLHGAILVAPILMAVWFSGEVGDQLIRHELDRSTLSSGAIGVGAAFIAPLLNPHGWLIWTVPFRLAEMVTKPHVPNPEWISPGFAEAPVLYAAFGFVAMVLIVGRASPQSWLFAIATAALAVKHIRNIGLFFVLLPQTIAPSLARWPLFAADGAPARTRPRARLALSLVLVGVLGVSAIVRPWPRAGFGFAENWYPDQALRFLANEHLLEGNLYNDVRFGGWLILDGYPDRQVFLDDRNEIHEPLLREIWEIFAKSDVAAWESLLDRWSIDTVLLRYHEPIAVTNPAGDDLGRRGFSTLWFRSSHWATVYWDDVAIVLVRRSSVPAAFLAAHEYRVARPDDFEHLTKALRTDPDLRREVAAELRRALAENPNSRRAMDLAVFLDLVRRD